MTTPTAADKPLEKRPRIKLSKTAWAKLRQYVIGRDGACVVCGYAGSMAPAHVKGRGAGGNDSPNNVVWLCQVGPNMTEGCHPKYDRYEIVLPYDIYYMLRSEPERL